MTSVYQLGGFIGRSATYKTGTTRKVLTYVGGQTSTGLGGTTDVTVNFSLTGGTNSTPQAGDYVVAMFAASVGTGGATLSYRISGYTQQGDLFANDTEDTELQVGTKFMPSTPDTSLTITGGSGNAAHAYIVFIQVWRNVDTTTPMDVTATTITGTNGLLVDPAAITPTTPGAQIIIAGAGAHTGGVDTYTASYLSNFLTTGSDDSDDIVGGLGNILWPGGAYNGAAWTSSEATTTSHSWASVTLALRPAVDSVQPGIFNLDAVQDTKWIASEWRYVRWSVTATKTAANLCQASEFVLRNAGADISMTGATVICSTPSQTSEVAANLIDGSTSTKFCSAAAYTTGPWVFTFDLGTAKRFDGYRWATAGDVEARDPYNYTVQVSEDGVYYRTVSTKTADAGTASRSTYVGPYSFD